MFKWGIRIVVVLGILAWLFVPHGVFKPNWETHYAAAEATGDCDRMKAINSGLLFSRDFAGHENEADMLRNGMCGFPKDPQHADEELDRLRGSAFTFSRRERLMANTNFNRLRSVWRLFSEQHEFVGFRYLADTTLLQLQCFTTGFPNEIIEYWPLRAVLRKENMTSLELADLMIAQGDYCAGIAVGIASRIRAESPEEEIAPAEISHWYIARNTVLGNPDMVMQIETRIREFEKWWDENDAARREFISKRNSGQPVNQRERLLYQYRQSGLLTNTGLHAIFQLTDGTREGLDEYDARCIIPASHPQSAFECIGYLVEDMNARPDETPYHSAFIEMYLQDLEAMGIKDISDLREKRRNLSAPCLAAVTGMSRFPTDKDRELGIKQAYSDLNEALIASCKSLTTTEEPQDTD
ncbi:MAG: hypothetical protein MRY59_07125 [Aquisalinus sp.]|nr:hypothetical protein [Aquisalinus sp.]